MCWLTSLSLCGLQQFFLVHKETQPKCYLIPVSWRGSLVLSWQKLKFGACQIVFLVGLGHTRKQSVVVCATQYFFPKIASVLLRIILWNEHPLANCVCGGGIFFFWFTFLASEFRTEAESLDVQCLMAEQAGNGNSCTWCMVWVSFLPEMAQAARSRYDGWAWISRVLVRCQPLSSAAFLPCEKNRAEGRRWDTLFLLHVSHHLEKGAILWEQRDHPDVIPSASSALLFLHYSLYHSIIPHASSAMDGRSPFRPSPGLDRQRSLFIAVALKRGRRKQQNKDLHCDH